MDNNTFYLVVDNLKDVVFQVDEEGCWVYLNPAWEKITGFSRKEAIGSHFQGYILPEDRKEVVALFRKIKSHNTLDEQTVARFISKSGKVIWAELSLKRIPGQEMLITGSLQDITSSIENEKRLKTTNKKLVEGLRREQALTEEYQSLNEKLLKNEGELRKKVDEVSEYAILFNLTQDLVAIADFNGYFLQLNPAWKYTLGYTIQELLNKPFLDFVHPEDRKETLRAAQKLGASDTEYVEFINRYRCKDGTYRWISWNAKSSVKHGKIYSIARDITDRVVMEEVLKTSENKFRLISENSADMVCTHDLDGTYTYISPSVEWLLGYQPQELIGSSPYDLFHADDIKRIKEASHDPVIDIAEENRIEYKIKKKNGQYIWFETVSRPIVNEDNVPIGIQTASRDISSRKHTEKALRESEEKYRSVVKALSEGIVVHAASGEITTCNIAAEEILGLSFDQMTGRSSLDPRWKAVHADRTPFPGETHPAMVTLKTGKAQRNVIMGVHKPDGELTWITVNSQPIFTEDKKNIQAVVASFTDITTQTKAEQALRESERRMKTLIANTPAVVYRCANDEAWTIDFISKEIQNISGYPIEDLANNQLRSYNSIIHPDDRQYVRQVVNHALEEKQSFQMEYRILHRNGSIRWVMGRGQGVLGKQGKVKFLDGIVLDITDKKNIERKIKRQNEQLKKANLEMDNFVYRVSHDLRAPLSSSLGLIEVIRNEHDEENKDAYLKLMHDMLQKQDKFIQDILDYSRNARLTPQITEINFEELIEEILEQLRFINNDKKIKQEVKISQKSTFYSDKDRLKIILSNLLSNAIRYANPKRADSFVEIKIVAGLQHTNIRVEDNGIGIHQQHLDKVFDMFYRATDTSPGSGLGLYIVHEAVKKLNGQIKVTSAIGEGTRFMLEIPNNKI